MSWVRRTVITPPAHTCAPPMREVWVTLPGMPPGPRGEPAGKPRRHRLPDGPDGSRGDLWRCDDCGALWCVGEPGRPRGGYLGGGLAWIPATWWQRLRHRQKVANGDQTTGIPRPETQDR